MTSEVFEIHQPGPDDWRTLRDIRLRALKDAPDAFGSTYAREVEFTESHWRRRLPSDTNVTYVAISGDRTVGIAGGFEDGIGVELVSMWVDPIARGSDLAGRLVAEVVTWAAGRGVGVVRLWVTEGNDRAARLYERCGFVPTSERQPVPHRPDVDELGMKLEM